MESKIYCDICVQEQIKIDRLVLERVRGAVKVKL